MGGLFVLTAALAAWPPAHDWAGAVVFPRDEQLALKDADGNPAGHLQTAGRVVKAGRDWVLIRHETHPGPYEGYADKAAVVPLGQAAAYFTARLAEDDEDYAALVKRAEARSMTGDHAGAVADYDDLLDWWPDPALVNLRGQARRRAGDEAGAEADFTEVVRLLPDHPSGYANRGQVRHARKDLAGAASDFAKALACDPDLAYVYVARGKLRIDRREYEGAVADFTAAVGLEPKDATAYHFRGAVWNHAGEYEDAVADLTEAVRLDPANTAALVLRGLAWAELKVYARADPDLTEVIRRGVAQARVYAARGDARYARDDYAGAMEDFVEAARLGLDGPEVRFRMGSARLMAGEVGRAYLDFDEVARRTPAGSEVRRQAEYYRGRAFARHGTYLAAVDKARQAADAAPDDVAAANDYAWHLATCPDGLFRDGKRAVELATKACERTGWKDAVCVGTLGAAYAEAGEFKKAAEYQARAMGDVGYFREHGAKAIERLKLYETGKPCREEPAAGK